MPNNVSPDAPGGSSGGAGEADETLDPIPPLNPVNCVISHILEVEVMCTCDSVSADLSMYGI